MGARISGDVKILDHVRRALAQLPEDAQKQIVKAARDTVAGAYSDQFASSSDPFGKPWPKGAEQPGKVHLRTAALSNPFVSVASKVISVKVERYGWIHHAGWVKATSGAGQNGGGREARELFPYRAGSWWWVKIKDTVNDQMMRAMMKAASASRGSVTRG